MYQEIDNDLLSRANELVEQGKYEAALHTYDELLNHKDQFYSHAMVQKIQLLETMGDPDGALALCDEAIRGEQYFKYFELKADLQNHVFERPLEAESNYKQALALLKQELKDHSTNVYLHIAKGLLLTKLNQHLEAIAALDHAEQLTTNVEQLGDVFFGKGECYRLWAELIDDLTMYEKALENFEKARRHGKNASHYIDHLTGYIRMNKALQQIEKKIAEHPEVAKHYFDKAQILWEMPNGLKMYHDIVHLLDLAESLSKSNKEKGEICYLKYVYYKKRKEIDAGYSFFDDKDTLSKKIDLLKKAFHYYKQCSKKDNVGYDTAYLGKLLANYYAQLGDESLNVYFYKLALDHYIFAREHSFEPYYGNIFKDSEAGIRSMKEKLEGTEYSEDDKSARTVEGILYQSVEEADEARQELTRVKQIKESVDLTDYESVLKALDTITKLNVETQSGKRLLREIQTKIEELDQKRRNSQRKLPQLDDVDEEDNDDYLLYYDETYDETYDGASDDEDQPVSGQLDGTDDEGLEFENVETDRPVEHRPQSTIFDDLDLPSQTDQDDEYERFVLDENDPRVQADLKAIAEVLQGDDYKRNESVAIRCLNQLQMMPFQTPIGVQFIHILERVVADFDLRARTVNGVIYASRYEAQELVDLMLDGHDCDSDAEQTEVLRFYEVVAKAKRNQHENLTLLNQVIPELNRKKFNKELLKPYLISLLDDKGKRELLSKLYSHQERTEMHLATQIMLWVFFFSISITFISFYPIVGIIVVAVTYPLYLFIRRGQEYLWKFFTNNGTIPISRYEQYFARPTLRKSVQSK